MLIYTVVDLTQLEIKTTSTAPQADALIARPYELLKCVPLS